MKENNEDTDFWKSFLPGEREDAELPIEQFSRLVYGVFIAEVNFSFAESLFSVLL